MNKEGPWDQIVQSLAYSFEKMFHGNPSGIDNLTVQLGGAVLFNKDSLKSCRRLESALLRDFQYLLIDTGVEKDTKRAVKMVQTKKDDH